MTRLITRLRTRRTAIAMTTKALAVLALGTLACVGARAQSSYQYHDLGTPPDASSALTPDGVNGQGVVVGNAQWPLTSRTTVPRAARWTPQTGARWLPGPLPGFDRSFARAVNAQSIIVGGCNGGGLERAWVYLPDDTALTDINGLLSPQDQSFWTVRVGEDINDGNLVVAYADHAGGVVGGSTAPC